MLKHTNLSSLVSIIMPTYNHGKYIGEAIDSVLNQSYHNFELVVIDNYSNDNGGGVVPPRNLNGGGVPPPTPPCTRPCIKLELNNFNIMN